MRKSERGTQQKQIVLETDYHGLTQLELNEETWKRPDDQVFLDAFSRVNNFHVVSICIFRHIILFAVKNCFFQKKDWKNGEKIRNGRETENKRKIWWLYFCLENKMKGDGFTVIIIFSAKKCGCKKGKRKVGRKRIVEREREREEERKKTSEKERENH